MVRTHKLCSKLLFNKLYSLFRLALTNQLKWSILIQRAHEGSLLWSLPWNSVEEDREWGWLRLSSLLIAPSIPPSGLCLCGCLLSCSSCPNKPQILCYPLFHWCQLRAKAVEIAWTWGRNMLMPAGSGAQPSWDTPHWSMECCRKSGRNETRCSVWEKCLITRVIKWALVSMWPGLG